MPVPKRRETKALSVSNLSSLVKNCFNIDFVFQKTKVFLLYGFAPAVIAVGLSTEPRPSLWDLFNIWE
jgi:hypothetical protein